MPRTERKRMNADLAAAVLDTARAMNRSGINRGSAGNVSVRCASSPSFLITPTGMAYEDCTADDMVAVALLSTDSPQVGAGDTAITGAQARRLAPYDRRAPSSEWRFHHDIYQHFPEAGAVVHTHANFATALACQSMAVPAFHYMVARFGGADVRCATYATFGTQALSDAIIAALAGRSACLMAHHGMVVMGRDLPHALALAIELETLCEQYWRTLQLGPVTLLPPDEMQRVMALFASYGQQD
jgi:L-fuculose-phosphate aldolase